MGNHYCTPDVSDIPMQEVKQCVGEEVPITLNKSIKTAEINLAGAHRSRTYRRHRKVPTNGFEVRGVHRGPSAPTGYQGSTWDSGKQYAASMAGQSKPERLPQGRGRRSPEQLLGFPNT